MKSISYAPRDGITFSAPGMEDEHVPRNINAVALACRYAFAKRVKLLTQIADAELIRKATLLTKTGEVVEIEIEPTIRERMEAVKILGDLGRVKEYDPPAEILPEELRDLLPPEGSPMTPLALLTSGPSTPASVPEAEHSAPFGSRPTDSFADALARVVSRLEGAAEVLSARDGAATRVAE